MRWRIEQAEEFRQEVEHYTDAERVILADAYQALLRYGPLAHASSPLVIHRFRDPRAGDAYECRAAGECTAEGAATDGTATEGRSPSPEGPAKAPGSP